MKKLNFSKFYAILSLVIIIAYLISGIIGEAMSDNYFFIIFVLGIAIIIKNQEKIMKKLDIKDNDSVENNEKKRKYLVIIFPITWGLSTIIGDIFLKKYISDSNSRKALETLFSIMIAFLINFFWLKKEYKIVRK